MGVIFTCWGFKNKVEISTLRVGDVALRCIISKGVSEILTLSCVSCVCEKDGQNIRNPSQKLNIVQFNIATTSILNM